MLAIGPYELHCIDAGAMRLDGGAMFGVVPRVLWEQHHVPDERHRITLAMRVLLAIDRRAGRVILVDTGPGSKWTPAERDRFGFDDPPDGLTRGLAALGVAEHDVTDVIVTHLHFDHNGGLTVDAAGAGQPRPRFPRARHWIHAGHLAHAHAPTVKDRASFYPRDFEAIERAGLFQVVDSAAALPFPNITWLIAQGHTPYQLLPRFEDACCAAQFVADLVPTAAHLPLPWIMAYDNEPLKTLQEKQRLMEDCARRDVILIFEHDPQVAAGRVDLSGRHPALGERLAME